MLIALGLAAAGYHLASTESRENTLGQPQNDPPAGNPFEPVDPLWPGMNPMMQPPNLQLHSIGAGQVHHPYWLPFDGFVEQNPLDRETALHETSNRVMRLPGSLLAPHLQEEVFQLSVPADLPLTGYNVGVEDPWQNEWSKSLASVPQPGIAVFQGPTGTVPDIPQRRSRGGVMGRHDETWVPSYGLALDTPKVCLEPQRPILFSKFPTLNSGQ